ncbi:MAG: helix-turn-helix domain-containing protein [Clostridia bacterium]|nr:helix-turn-helix domain-containing protein [Clostridia bacterium]
MKQDLYKNYEDLPLLLTAKELSRLLRISRSGAYALMAKEGFPSVSLGKRIVVPKEGLLKWLREATKE